MAVEHTPVSTPFPALFHPAVMDWLRETFPAPTRAQVLGWPEIVAGNSTLILAPTGSGKTLAAFLAAIDRLMFSPVPAKQARCRVLYISPLRALAFDVERNLRAPLVGIARVAERQGATAHVPTVGLRTGDTEAGERARMARTPPDILITTPESLYLVLTSQARAILQSIELVIVDEIHTLASTKRGAHLALSLERLAHLTGRPFQRVGLSATQRPLEEVARYLGGGTSLAAQPPLPRAGEGEDSRLVSAALHEPGASTAPLSVTDTDTATPAGSGATTTSSILPLSRVRERGLGGEVSLASWTPRPVAVVDAGVRKRFDLRVEVPVEDMSRLGETMQPAQGEIPEGPTSVLKRNSIWPAIYPRLLELIRAHRSTIVFVNSRRLAERTAGALNELAGEEIAQAHHGSIAREQRVIIEDRLKAGQLPAMVATSSLELGIDMGAVDLVVQIETPPSVASGLQRIGRAGHQVEGVSRGIIFPKFRGDLLATAAITRAMAEGRVEETRVPRNPLDVLTQQIVAMCAVGEWRVDDLHTLVRQAAPFASLTRGQLEGVLDMLSGRYPADELAELRARITWDRLKGTVRAREGLQRLVVANAGTIPDRGLYGVFLADGSAQPKLGAGDLLLPADGPGANEGAMPLRRARSGRRVGELDEEMVFETHQGDIVVLGASSWRVVEITRDRVLVEPAPGEPGRMPFWRGDSATRPVELGAAIGRLTRELGSMPHETARTTLMTQHSLEPQAADNLLAYLEDQRAAIDAVPDDRTVVIERSRDELGDWRLCLLSPWGGRVHAPWALALQAKLRATDELEAETIWSDDGIVVRLPDRGTVPDTSLLLPDPDEIEDLVVRELGGSALFAARFREAAGRALLIPRNRPGQRAPLWMQRKRAADLLAVAAQFGSFPIVLESYRECLQDVFDLPALTDLARRLQRREVRVVTVDAEAPSPFAASLLFGYVANFIYDGDAPLAERRAQALAVDQAQLRELLGAAELRELLDAEVLEALELTLQGLGPTYRVRSPDRLHDLLLRIGDLTLTEVVARCEAAAPPLPRAAQADEWAGEWGASPAAAWLAELEAERRVIRLHLGSEERFAAVEDAGRLRDAFGASPPAGIPAAFLEPVPTALQEVVARYARTHAPFRALDVARRYGSGEAPVLAALGTLAERGRVLEGEFRPGGSGREWCDADVLANARRRSLAKLRKQVEPAEPAALGRLLVEWQHVATTLTPRSQMGGPDRLLDVIEQLQGAAIPASVLETDVLPARLPRYRPRDLDLLCAAGEVVLVGAGPLGERDGKITMYLADDVPLLQLPQPEPPDGEYHRRLRAHLARSGASFFAELQMAAGGPAGMVLDALWDLVWAGIVTNDSPAALRAYLSGTAAVRAMGKRRSGPFRSRRQAPPSAVGRWSLVSADLAPLPVGEGSRGEEVFSSVSSTERARALAELLVHRHGILTRPAVLSEGVPGGFAALYPVLASLEEAGRLRRGYFLAGLGGAQFAQAGAVDRLRSLRENAAQDDPDALAAVVLAATDPANPYGAALPWPTPAVASAPKPIRSAGARVILVDGALAAFVRGDRDVATFLPADEPARSAAGRAAAKAVARWAVATGRVHLGWATVDGAPSGRSPFAAYLTAAGFVSLGSGFRLVSSGSGRDDVDHESDGDSPANQRDLGLDVGPLERLHRPASGDAGS